MTKRGFWVARDLQDDRKLRGLKLAAGLLSVLVLVAMFVTSVSRVPEPAWSVVMVVTAVVLTALIARGMVHGTQRGRSGSTRERPRKR